MKIKISTQANLLISQNTFLKNSTLVSAKSLTKNA